MMWGTTLPTPSRQALSSSTAGTDRIPPPADDNRTQGDGQTSGAGIMTTDARHARIYQACDSCRQKKLKCDLGPVDNPDEPPCARCRRESKDCTFRATRKRVTRGVPVEEYVERNKRQRTIYESGGARTSTVWDHEPYLGSPVERRSTDPATLNIPSRQSYQPPVHSPSRAVQHEGSQDDGVPETELLHKVAYTEHDALNLLYRAGCQGQYSHLTPPTSKPSETPEQVATSPAETRRPASGPSPGWQSARQAWSRVKFVQDGFFTAEEAIAYIDYFHEHIDPFTPVTSSAYKDHSMHLKLTQDEPILATTMLVLASRFYRLPGPCSVSRGYVIHDRLWTFLRNMITRIIWGMDKFPGPTLSRRSLRTLGTCEALMLLVDWHPRCLHFAEEEDSISILPRDHRDNSDGAKELTGATPLFWLEWSWRSDRMSWSLLGTALTLATELGIFDEYDNTTLGAREAQAADWERSSFQNRALRLQQLTWVYSTQASGRFGYKYVTPFSIVEKPGSRHGVTSLWVGMALVMRKVNELLFPSREHTKEIISNGRYLGLLYILQPTLTEWAREFEGANLSKEMRATLNIEYGYSRVYMNSVALQAVIQYGASKNAKPIHAGNEEFLVEVIEGSRAILRTVVEDLLPEGKVKFIPVRTYSRVLSGALFLLKSTALNRSPDEAYASLDLVDQAASAFQESVVDDVNLSTRWGQLLAGLSRGQRARVRRNYIETGEGRTMSSTTSSAATSSAMSIPLPHTSDTISIRQDSIPTQSPDVTGMWDESDLPDLVQLGQFDSNFMLPDWLGFPLDPLRNVAESSAGNQAWMNNQGLFDMLGSR